MNEFDGHRIAVVDTDRRNLDMLEEYLTRNGATGVFYSNARDAIDGLEAFDTDALITDVKLDDVSGIDLLHTVRSHNPQLPVVLMTASETTETAINGLSEGAFGYLTKPFPLKEFGILLARTLEYAHLVSDNQRLQNELNERTDDYGLIGDGFAIRNVRGRVEMVAPSQANVTILGEPGTGIEAIARAIHRQSPRAEAPFVRFDCTAYREHRFELELFGNVGDRETGASARPGKIELAERGTLFLDEVSAIPLNVQQRILRLVQDGELYRIGTSNFRKANVRVISTSSRNLEDEVLHHGFREDLYFRLNVIPIRVPPLRERRDDIIPLTEHFVERFARESRRPVKNITVEALKLLQGYDWVGNIRELALVVEHAVMQCESDVLDEGDFVSLLAVLHRLRGSKTLGSRAVTLAEVERQHVLTMYALKNYNQTHTASVLDISLKTLRNKLRGFRNEEMGNG